MGGAVSEEHALARDPSQSAVLHDSHAGAVIFLETRSSGRVGRAAGIYDRRDKRVRTLFRQAGENIAHRLRAGARSVRSLVADRYCANRRREIEKRSVHAMVV